MLSDIRGNGIKREALMTWSETSEEYTLTRQFLFLNSVKERDLIRPFWSKSLSWCINFKLKVFCESTHFEGKFSLNTPILKRSFLWIHPFWDITLQWEGEGIRIRKISDRPSLETMLPKKTKNQKKTFWRKVFSWMHPKKVYFRNFEGKFSLNAPLLSVHERFEKNQSP